VSGALDCLIDLGHTRIKWAAARSGQIQPDRSGACAVDDAEALEVFLGAGDMRRAWLCASAGNDRLLQTEERIDRCGLSLIRVQTGAIDLPVRPAYASLGCDRWLCLQWAWQESRDACCVVDCGTAVTVDLVDRSGCHLGGWIMAGLATVRAGLLGRARGLPREFEPMIDPARPMRDSAQAIAAGTLLQVTVAIDRAVTAAARQMGATPTVWLTGGDSDAVAGHLETPVRRDPLLVLRGLAMAAGEA